MKKGDFLAERIYTIPVNETFEEKCGCPICKIRDILEERSLEYVLGPAMMESDVRLETNKKGFCKEHFFMLANRRARLPLALITETHLDEVIKGIKKKKFRPDKKEIKSGEFKDETCYVCDRINWAKERMFATIAKLYSEEMDFRNLFREQEYICLKHCSELHAYSALLVSSKWRSEFQRDVDALTLKAAETLREEVHYFTQMFDYRNAGENADFKNTRDSIERTISFLTSRLPEDK